jgi:hypothetical protein
MVMTKPESGYVPDSKKAKRRKITQEFWGKWAWLVELRQTGVI